MFQQNTQPNALFTRQIRQACENNEFEIYYQPVFNLRTGRVEEFEALLRWNTPDGILSPGSFLRQAQENGMIDVIGEWVVKNVCRDIVKWFNCGHTVPPVSINFSEGEIKNPSFVNKLYAIVSSFGINPNMIVVEISATALDKDYRNAVSTVAKLRDCGFLVSIDNFGRDSSNIKALLDVDCLDLKIDGNLLESAKISKRGFDLVLGTVALLRSLNINVIAERIENEEQLDFVRQLGFNLVQGYYFSTAIRGDEARMYMV